MTKKLTTPLTCFFLCLNGMIYAQNSKLNVQVTGFDNKKHTKIFISVFSKDGFLETSVKTKSVMALGQKINAEFELPPGEYAVYTYHDVNNNGKLDRRFYGKPKEPYGFSKNIRPFGKPSFDKCKFALDKSSQKISIVLID